VLQGIRRVISVVWLFVISVYDMILYDIFIYCSWISPQWQRSVDLYRNRKDTAIYIHIYIYIYTRKKKQSTEQHKTQKTRNLLTYSLHGAESFLRS